MRSAARSEFASRTCVSLVDACATDAAAASHAQYPRKKAAKAHAAGRRVSPHLRPRPSGAHAAKPKNAHRHELRPTVKRYLREAEVVSGSSGRVAVVLVLVVVVVVVVGGVEVVVVVVAGLVGAAA
jgi:cobalamin biosynthesis Mg chelatase CobN